MNVGGFSALFFSPYCADQFGRRVATAVGVIILVVGVIMQCKCLPTLRGCVDML